ncbi:MlaD family protein [Caulobacter sp. KR2-114]|uniref:MlaD family protein n=1 Tax=Caulobacter sp. KR2-114 TaxID=3400912 RepID=UPI003BFCB77F
MERNANYFLVGVVSTILLVATIVFVVWLAQFNLHQKFDTYIISFKGPVRGISNGGEVHFNGIKVGEISRIALDAHDPTMVDAEIKVTSDVPIRQDSVAMLEPQGITGVNYVQIGAGTPSKPLLRDLPPPPGFKYPVIQSQRDAFSDLLSGGSAVVAKAVESLNRVNRVLSDDNIKTFSATLSDVQAVTAELRARKQIIADADKALQSADQAAQQIKTLAHSSQVLVEGDGTRSVRKLGDAAEQIEAAAKDVRTLLGQLQGPTGDFAKTGLPQIQSAVTSLQQATEHLDQVIDELQQSPQGLVSKPPSKEVEVKP